MTLGKTGFRLPDEKWPLRVSVLSHTFMDGKHRLPSPPEAGASIILKQDILTGSRPDGTAFPGTPFQDMTCGNWTKSGTDGSAMLGHHDRAGPIDHPWAVSWNSAHPSLGCGQERLRPTGGDGLFYCFVAN